MEKIKKLRQIFSKEKIDGYIVSKNDEFFGEYIPKHNDRLNYISNFSGSYGFALILKNKNYLFVDGRYTLQANNQCGKYYKIVTFPTYMPNDILKNEKLSIGFDPKLFTQKTLNIFFGKNNCNFLPLANNLNRSNLEEKNKNSKTRFYKLPKYSTHENYVKKINKIVLNLKKRKQIFN